MDDKIPAETLKKVAIAILEARVRDHECIGAHFGCKGCLKEAEAAVLAALRAHGQPLARLYKLDLERFTLTDSLDVPLGTYALVKME